MGLMDARVVLISGAARGMGRAHAVTLAREGADIVAFDICEQIAGSSVPMATEEDLEQTRRMVESQGRSCLAAKADARSAEQVAAVVADGLSRFGKIDAAVVNHGIVTYAPFLEHTEEQFRDQLEVNLLAPFLVAKAVAPSMIDRGAGGSIVIISSGSGLMAWSGVTAYTAAKHGLLGLMKSIALELAPHSIRCNAICPGAVNTTMIHDPSSYQRVTGKPDSTWEEVGPLIREFSHKLPIEQLQPEDISEAVLYFASDMAKHVTGTILPVDAGAVMK